MPEPIILCTSGGKDSCLALHQLQSTGQYAVAALLTTITDPYERVTMHGVRADLLHTQADALGLPLDEVRISPHAANDEYERQMGVAFDRLREQGFRRVAFGDIFLADLREYREQMLARHDLEAVFPLWQRDTRQLVDDFIAAGFRAVTVCVDSKKLDAGFAGRLIDREFVESLPAGVDPCGENGEFHSFVFDGPTFHREVPVRIGETVLRDSYFYCDLLREKPTAAVHADQ